MARRLSPEKQAEYDALQHFGTDLAAYLGERGLLPQASVAAIASALRPMEGGAPAPSLSGLRMAIGDLLDMTRHLDTAAGRDADEFLRTRGAPTLTAMRVRIWRQIPGILARGQVRNDEEFYLLSACLNDVAASEFTPEERERAAAIVAAYETSR